MREYKFKTTPYKHQLKALTDSWAAEYYALFMEMGTGKSKVAIDTIGALYGAGEISAALILAPKGVYDNWVQGEIPTHLPDDIKRLVVRWTPSNSKKFQDEMKALVYEPFLGLRVFVMNIEALSTPRGTKAAYAFLKRNPDNIMVVDESTTIKNRKATRTKNVMMLAKEAKYKRILTGSPVTKSPMDLYSQCAFLSPDALGFSSYYSFQGRYAVVQKRQFGQRAIRDCGLSQA